MTKKEKDEKPQNKSPEQDDMKKEECCCDKSECCDACEEETKKTAEEVCDAPEETVKTEEVTIDEALNRKLDELNEKYLRLYADFDNYKKRAVKEKMEASAYAIGGLMSKLLNVTDNFARALETESEDKSFYEGVKMVSKQLDDILTAEGLKPIEAVGEKFDPNYHNAVMTDSDESYDDDTVTAELQRGYVYKDKVIRPSMVRVNKK